MGAHLIVGLLILSIGAAINLWMVARLSAVNPHTTLPLIGRPANLPRGYKAMVGLVTAATISGVQVIDYSHRLLHYAAWSVAVGTAFILSLIVPLLRHNQRVRRNKLASP